MGRRVEPDPQSQRVWMINPNLRMQTWETVEPVGGELLGLTEAPDDCWLGLALRRTGITDGRDRLVLVAPQMELFA